MIPAKKNYNVSPEDIAKLLETHYSNLMKAFYESQSSFLCGVYKRYKGIETGNIILCFARNVHLKIIRQREKDLNYNVSLENFWRNFLTIDKPEEKITSIVNITGIPKETVRRKIRSLANMEYLYQNNKNRYSWNLKQDERDSYYKIIDSEVKNLSIFISKIANFLGLKSQGEKIESEIRAHFSFYWYHYLSCQLEWLKWWQTKLKDNDLLLISLQAIIPTLHFIEKERNSVKINNLFKIIGEVDIKKNVNCAISATSVSEVTGIPRATCIRKLDKLINLGFLIRESDTKRYSINQSIEGRTKNILNRQNVTFTIKTLSEYISIMLNSLIQNKLIS